MLSKGEQELPKVDETMFQDALVDAAFDEYKQTLLSRDEFDLPEQHRRFVVCVFAAQIAVNTIREGRNWAGYMAKRLDGEIDTRFQRMLLKLKHEGEKGFGYINTKTKATLSERDILQALLDRDNRLIEYVRKRRED